MGMTETASRLIARHGSAATLLRPGPGSTDEQGGYIPGATTAFPVTVFVAAYDISEEVAQRGIIDNDDRRVFVSTKGLSITPQTTDRLLVFGKNLDVVRVSPLSPAGDVIFWEVQARERK